MVSLERAQAPTGPGILRIALYVAAALAGPLAASVLVGSSGHNFIYTLGLHFALAAFALVGLQVVLAARFRCIEWPFGLDMMFRFHKAMALVAGTLLVLHPIFLAWGRGSSRLLFATDVSWKVYLGRVALLLLLVNWFVSQFRQEVSLEFQKWRWVHNLLGLAVITLGFLHSFFIGHDLAHAGMQALWIAAMLAVVGVYVYHKLIRSLQMRRHAYRVVEVRKETHDVTTVLLEPPAGQRRYDYWPGQFHYVNFHRQDRSLPHEEHHWTISVPPDTPHVGSTIKASGDFTSTIDRTREGDRAEVLGAYGRFSYVLYGDEGDLVFIAGGIGITPLMAMIRHMHRNKEDRNVLLLYANKTQADIVFREELDRIAASPAPHLTVVHVLSRPEDSWDGPRGLVDREFLDKHCGEVAGKAFYVCGPPPMADMVISILRKMGVSEKAIHYERFAL